MGQIVLGLAGAGIGFLAGGATGAQIGWTLAAFAWNLLNPPKTEGPRLSDLHIQGAAFGRPISIVYGRARIAGNGCFQTDWHEHKHKGGGKGASQPPSYTYTASWGFVICEGPIVGVIRRWCNKKLWTEEGAESNDHWPFALYLGTEDQMPDPTIEAEYGAGEVSAQRGVAYEVVTEKDGGDFNNVVPNVEYDVFTKGGDIPWRVSTFTPWGSGTLSNFNLSNGTVRGDVIFATELESGSNVDIILRKWNKDGTQIGSDLHVPTMQNSQLAVYNSDIFLTWANTGSGTNWYWWAYNASLDTYEMVHLIDDDSDFGSTVASRAALVGDYIVCLGNRAGDTYVSLVPVVGGVPGNHDPLLDQLVMTSAVPANFQILASNDDTFYLLYGSYGNAKLWHYDQELNLLHFWDTTDTSGTVLHQSVLNGYVWNDLIVVATNEGSIGGGIGDYRIRLVRINGDLTLEDYGSNITHGNTLSNFVVGGLLIDSVGLYSLNPPPVPCTLGEIVLDLCVRAGYTEDQIDVADLTQEVTGFVVASQMEVRNAIDELRRAHFFDPCEVDGKVLWRNRGHDAIATIPDVDLGAREYGAKMPTPLQTIRTPESELPRTVTVKYYNIDNDYQEGTQYATRQVTSSQTDVTLSLAIVMSDTEALTIAYRHLYLAWLEREQFVFYTSRKWSHLVETDVVVVRGRNMRIVEKSESPGGVIRFKAVLAFAGPYTQSLPAPAGSAPSTQTVADPPVATQLVLLDIPNVSQNDAPFGIYAAMGPAADGPWPGATLYKSLDGGTTWLPVASADVAAIIGRTAEFTGSPAVSGALSSWGGGDTLDPTVIRIALSDDDAELESCTDAALDAGANLCAIRTASGWEILQFRDVDLVAPKTYDVWNWKRGRKGTGTSGHANGDTFVVLPVTNVDGQEVEIGAAVKFKAVTYGTAITDAAEQTFTNTGLSTTSFYDTEAQHWPVHTNEQTGTTYELTTSDRAHILPFNNGSGVVVSLPDDMPDGWWCAIENVGAGDVVLTPDTWVIDDGATDLTLSTDQGVLLFSSGAQWWTMRGMGGGGGGSYTPSEAVNAQTGTTYTAQASDRAKLVTLANASAVAVTLPQATGSFGAGWYCDVKNLGAGAVTITPTTSTIGGAATLVLTTGQSARIVSDGTNYLTAFLPPGPGVNPQTGTSYTYVSGDRGKLVTHTNSSAIAGTLPQATGAFGAGWFVWVQNRGAGVLTITPTTSTIDGASSLVLSRGQGVTIFSDGTNYFTARGGATHNLVVLSPSYSTPLNVDLAGYEAATHFQVNVGTLTGNVALNISNGVDGQIIRVRLKQDGTGGRTLTFGANVRTSTDTPLPILSTTGGVIDRLAFEWHGADGKADLVAVNRGYS